MSEGLNKVLLIGNLGVDPELKYTQGGQAVLRIRLATTERFAQQGERKERTEWHTVIVWGNRAEALSKYLHKGKTIYVEGRLQTRQWEDKDGGKRSATEVVANQILLLGGGQQGGQRDEREPRGQSSRTGRLEDFGPADEPPMDDMGGDIPF
jgi:single-strand DNA-binding protein